MKRLKYILPPLISLIMMVCYYTPWITYKFGNWNQSDARWALGFYILAVLGLIFGWIPLIICTILGIVMKIKSKPSWIMYTISAVSILLFYIGVVVGIINNYMVTV